MGHRRISRSSLVPPTLLPRLLHPVRIFRALAGFAADLDQARGSSLVLLRLCGSGRVFHLRGRTRMVEAGFDHADVVVATRQDTAEVGVCAADGMSVCAADGMSARPPLSRLGYPSR